MKIKKRCRLGEFSSLISEEGQFYQISICFNKKVVNINDSLKLIPFSVEKIAKDLKLPIKKLELDYKKVRYVGHKLSKKEKDYITNDVKIIAMVLKEFFNQGFTKITRASNALADFKKLYSDSEFSRIFPELENTVDEEMRYAYRGGFTFLNFGFEEIDIEKGYVLDVNSLYPSVMKEKPMPIGEPHKFDGKYKKSKMYPLYIQGISCSFELKENKIPCIQIKNDKRFISTEYLKSSNGEIVCLYLTNIDLDLFFENYNVYDLEYLGGFSFRQKTGIFTAYIEKWIEEKNQGSISGNNVQRTLAKLMLNSLYGKFASRPDGKSKIPLLLDEEKVGFRNSELEERPKMYLPIGIFITSYAREKTIRTAGVIQEYSLKKYGHTAFVYS